MKRKFAASRTHLREPRFGSKRLSFSHLERTFRCNYNESPRKKRDGRRKGRWHEREGGGWKFEGGNWEKGMAKLHNGQWTMKGDLRIYGD